jgi:hypothetical protein
VSLQSFKILDGSAGFKANRSLVWQNGEKASRVVLKPIYPVELKKENTLQFAAGRFVFKNGTFLLKIKYFRVFSFGGFVKKQEYDVDAVA